MTAVKCLVWDLDGTLWRGTLLEGDDVVLAEGVLDVLRELDERGILHSIASRNDHEAAWARLNALGVADYFLYAQIGWGRKPDAVQVIAEELNFALDAMAFVDDQPAERAEMALRLPQVRSYPADQLARLPELPDFTPDVVTKDARHRRRLYRAGARRAASRAAFTGPDEEFLRSLGMVMRIGPATGKDLHRVAELTRRTSQMNTTGVRYPADALGALCLDPNHAVLLITLEDRFGPHGAVGVVLVERHPRCWHLKLLATSCRVVSFGAGSVLVRWLVNRAAGEAMHLVADFRRTNRNRIMEVAYRFAGFADASCECQGTLAEPADSGTARLHLVPSPVNAGAAIRLLTHPSIVAKLVGGHATTSAKDGQTDGGITQEPAPHSGAVRHLPVPGGWPDT